MDQSNYRDNVFVNCPFDEPYRPLFEAIVFAVHDCGYIARCALEIDDASQVRIDKIFDIVSECRLGIHDISLTELDAHSGLPRFNMPLELGIFLGAKRYGHGKHKEKLCLILDKERYRYQQYCSDIAGQDIRSHDKSPHQIITVTRNWLRNASTDRTVIMPSGTRMAERYDQFRDDLPLMCEVLGLDPDELIFNDFTTFVSEWLKVNSW